MMPYIKQIRRDELDNGSGIPQEPGELNYKITQLCRQYITDHGMRYAVINTIVGALDCVKLEFYRRLASVYEDAKIIENGDVYL
jgi:hypothetical protein